MSTPRVLYAVASEYLNSRNQWAAEIVYVHAENATHARAVFFQSVRRPTTRIVPNGIGPVVGYFVEDEHGEKLSAD